MRLHRLALTAFGPFAGREEVDFDALGGSGLFLLHGPTGAGKTSVLDAVCFALYGVVPGPRRGARLRSDHADASVAPEVTCEFSVGSRRLEVTRSPAWERPKRRGEGTTTEQARVAVRELVAGEWLVRATRIDEAALLLDDLLGMGHEQFTKLVLLPQGDFAAFLRADAETRRAMLERLFDTDRFSAVQTWLRERAATGHREVEACRSRTRELLARAEQAAVHGPGTADRPDDPPDDPPEPCEVVARLLAQAVHAWEDATTRRAATHHDLARARTAHTAALDLARRQAEHARLTGAASRLAGTADQVAASRRRLAEAERARGVAPAAPVLVEAEAALDAARARLDEAVAAASRGGVADTLVADGGLDEALSLRGVLLLDPVVLAGLDDATLADAARTLRERAGHAQAVAREAGGLDAARRAAGAVTARAEAARQTLADAVDGSTALAPALAEATDQLARARTVAAGLPAAEAALIAAESVARAALRVQHLSTVQRDARPALEAARDHRDELRAAWLDLRERRLDHMAAELAEGLAGGQPCPVCGSPEHPEPARPGADRVTEAAEVAAREALEVAEEQLAAVEAAAADLARSLAEAVGATGGAGPEQAADQLAAARTRAEEARLAADGLAGRQDAVDRLAAAADQAGGAIDEARTRLHELETELAARTSAVVDLAARVDAVRGDDPTVTARVVRLTAAAEATDAVLRARQQLAEALRAAATARRSAMAAAREAGFGGVAAALAAVLPESDRVTLDEAVRAHDAESAAVAAHLADPSLVAAGAEPAPDLAALADAETQAAADDESCARLIGLAERAVEQLRALATDLDAHLAAAEPLERRQGALAELARCADGTGGDNALRMSLSAYVLAARLEEVADGASRRLGQMSGGRYSLVHTDETVKGQRRAGLGLAVVDHWTGRRRDTASLSGGESFYTSLALALGLADVVSAEAGGTSIETLFVDEGFGSLDEDTLEEVMDTLDGLRSGGRTVGLVSHVGDLRSRIPSRIEVVKDRDGSHLSVVGLPA